MLGIRQSRATIRQIDYSNGASTKQDRTSFITTNCINLNIIIRFISVIVTSAFQTVKFGLLKRPLVVGGFLLKN